MLGVCSIIFVLVVWFLIQLVKLGILFKTDKNAAVKIYGRGLRFELMAIALLVCRGWVAIAKIGNAHLKRHFDALQSRGKSRFITLGKFCDLRKLAVARKKVNENTC